MRWMINDNSIFSGWYAIAQDIFFKKEERKYEEEN